MCIYNKPYKQQKMKKLFVIAIVAAGTFLASCGGNSNEATAPATDTTCVATDTAAVAVDTAATETADTTAVK